MGKIRMINIKNGKFQHMSARISFLQMSLLSTPSSESERADGGQTRPSATTTRYEHDYD